MIEANAYVFATLESYCSAHGDPVDQPGAPRYIHGDSTARRYLKYLGVGPILRFGYHRSLANFHLESEHFIALTGFEFEPSFQQEPAFRLLTPIPLDPGIAVCTLFAARPRPTASASTIKNIVDVFSGLETNYRGHRIDDVVTLFPSIQLFRCTQPLDEDACWRIFLMLSADECQKSGSWIESELAEVIVALADLEIPFLPYEALCRSMFDYDPRSLFMALYRCIEATYAYESCRKLVNRLSIGTAWHDLAAALESEVGWHPREAASLNIVLQYAHQNDLADICSLLNTKPGDNLADSAGRAIYKTRNSFVHFRPGNKPPSDLDSMDWNKLCRLLAQIVFSVFSRAYA
ncbi:hypothetical protein BH11ACT6_BH11ACT6_12000 [soil metagenome]